MQAGSGGFFKNLAKNHGISFPLFLSNKCSVSSTARKGGLALKAMNPAKEKTVILYF